MADYAAIDPERQIKLKEIIGRLHAGSPAGEVKREFAKLIRKRPILPVLTGDQ